jgi:hypothetical protein
LCCQPHRLGPTTRFVIIDPTDGIVGNPAAPGSVDNTVQVRIEARDVHNNLVVTETRSVDIHLTNSATPVGGATVALVAGVGLKNIENTIPGTVVISLVDSQGTMVDVTSTQNVVIVPGTSFNLCVSPSDPRCCG